MTSVLNICRNQGEKFGVREGEVNRVCFVLQEENTPDCYRFNSVTFLLKWLKMANSGSYKNMTNLCPKMQCSGGPDHSTVQLIIFLTPERYLYPSFFSWSTREGNYQLLNSLSVSNLLILCVIFNKVLKVMFSFYFLFKKQSQRKTAKIAQLILNILLLDPAFCHIYLENKKGLNKFSANQFGNKT